MVDKKPLGGGGGGGHNNKIPKIIHEEVDQEWPEQVGPKSMHMFSFCVETMFVFWLITEIQTTLER